VEYILYGTTKYFVKRYAAISPNLADPAVRYGYRVHSYMDEKIEKARSHSVIVMGTMQQRYEVACRGRLRRGVRRERVIQECLLREDGTAFCSCHKPYLLHVPCSHVIAACRESALDTSIFVSEYFLKGTIAQCWSQEVYGVGIFGPFVGQNDHVMYIPDPASKKGGRGRRQSRRIRNNMDEAEAGKAEKRCSKCNAMGHTYKKCPQNTQDARAEAPPAANPDDGTPPFTRQAPTSRENPMRSVSSRRSVSSHRDV
jgi:hypothetical protein